MPGIVQHGRRMVVFLFRNAMLFNIRLTCLFLDPGADIHVHKYCQPATTYHNDKLPHHVCAAVEWRDLVQHFSISPAITTAAAAARKEQAHAHTHIIIMLFVSRAHLKYRVSHIARALASCICPSVSLFCFCPV